MTNSSEFTGDTIKLRLALIGLLRVSGHADAFPVIARRFETPPPLDIDSHSKLQKRTGQLGGFVGTGDLCEGCTNRLLEWLPQFGQPIEEWR